jgi:sugar (pentulose or hexulose) kinase
MYFEPLAFVVSGETSDMADFIGTIDQGTTSTRFIVFDRDGAMVSVAQTEHRQIYPAPGHVEHDALEIWRNTQATAADALAKAGLGARDLRAVGVTNQRETTLLWDRHTGAPLHNALVWQDTRVDPLVDAFCGSAGATASAPRPACRSRAISAASSCAGCWTPWPAPASAPWPATPSSAPSTAGSSGT